MNLDKAVVDSFGAQWTVFDQSGVSTADQQQDFDAYFRPFRWDLVNDKSVGFDMGCGTGRWDKYIAPRVGHLHCIEPSNALEVAKRTLRGVSNVTFHRGSLSDNGLTPATMDFGVCVGVLHYVPDAAAGIKACAALLKPGAPLLVYIYYRFDNRPIWFRAIWQASDVVRRAISKLPFGPRKAVTNVIAALVYWPAARLALAAERAGANVSNWPLSSYRNKPFYTLKTDCLDRLGTQREHRYTRAEIKAMMEAAGLTDVRFSEDLPFWCACAVKPKP
ncbi:MAG TPA: class I SAM-dependent methyltransferase [Rhizomicrobium sp.]|nr:class I SAM-dependent methyltransferase [Rhizomicrobium sp.]